jgi:predicted metal-dependent hydrolase
VAEIEETVRGRVKMARDRGKMGMLLSTIALEHFTAMMAEMHARHRDLFDETPAGVEQLWRWHAMEETEHKAVAYDVFLEVTKDWSPWKRYLIRCRTMALVTLMFTRNISRYAARLLEADGYTPQAALKAVKRFVWGDPGIFRRGWKTYFAWYRPGFHPWDQDDREQFADWKAEFDAAVT